MGQNHQEEKESEELTGVKISGCNRGCLFRHHRDTGWKYCILGLCGTQKRSGGSCAGYTGG